MPIISNFPTGSSGSSGGLALSAVSNIETLVASEKVYVKWTDPEDLVVSGSTLAGWAGTILVRKAGSVPTSRRDGTIVIDSTTRNAYSDTYFCDSGLSNGVTYYYKFFSYTTANVYTDIEDNVFTATPTAIAPANVSSISTTYGNAKINLKWTDPDDTVTDGITVSEWAGTKVVYKTSSYPTSPDDGTLVINSTTKNGYKNTALVIDGLTNGTTYYIALFPYSVDGAVNTNASNRITAIPNRITISTVPSQSGSLTYSGSDQSPTWNNYDSTKMTLGGTTSGTNAGSYNATFTPKDDYCWSDDTTTAKTITWSIGKAAGNLSISPTSLTLNSSATSKTIAVTRAGDGTITAISDNTSVATVSVSGTTVTVQSVNNTTGTATITIKVAAGTNHTAPSNQTCFVDAQFLPAKDTLQNMSWVDIQTICKAGKASEYWEIGDRKIITVNGTYYIVDLIGFDHDTPTDTSAYGRSKAGATFQLHDLLSTTYPMNSNNTNSGGWESSVMRTSTMATLFSKLNSDLKKVIVPVNKLSGTGNDSSSGVKTTSDSLFLLAEIEIFGSTTYSVSGEGSQYAYYAIGNSKVKNKDGSANNWWARSPRSTSSSYFCCVYSTGTAYTNNAISNNGVSFGFCV